ncbi:hypothetical protein VOLCADRAFT_89376 [Volvox carteri f. nagariensis]|uniref:Uncharacterized protein n=1 Tax=Volvox carteri f. nagariensis TaxID=3068 RepID=D8TRJ4_VOLCA|nr:uncharacterized protein VOLCADRAFT_89376 [Volvox carteri f. nagariensis]EFJ49903.1 hypothetical protein VOLCADRAFT_89376 [Volvox carteri f. nagariensis]|eukprot:XP_002948968.1 hypothetical protein VOLCADRAFT_89376 [Volvox carteri f. nagariensis]
MVVVVVVVVVVVIRRCCRGSSGPLAGQLLASFTSPSRTGPFMADLLVTTGGVAEATVSHTFTVPVPAPAPAAADRGSEPTAPPGSQAGKLVLGGVASVPALAEKSKVWPPKVTLDYVGNYLHIKTSSSLGPKPLISAAAVGGTGRVDVGGEAAYSSSALRVTSWTAAAAWHDERQHVELQLRGSGVVGVGSSSNGGGKATLLYGYSLKPGVALGLEAVADLKPAMEAFFAPPPPPATAGDGNGGGASGGGGGKSGAGTARAAAAAAAPPAFAIGASFKVPKKAAAGTGTGRGSGGGGGGGVVKVKISSRGVVSLLYRDTLAAGPRVTFTAEVDGLNPGTRPRLGLQLEV